MRFSQTRLSCILALISAACVFISLTLTPGTGAPRRLEYVVRSESRQASTVNSQQVGERHTGAIAAEVAPGCSDREETCQAWSKRGECLSNPVFMLEACTASCGVCLQRFSAQGHVSLDVKLQHALSHVAKFNAKAMPLTHVLVIWVLKDMDWEFVSHIARGLCKLGLLHSMHPCFAFKPISNLHEPPLPFHSSQRSATFRADSYRCHDVYMLAADLPEQRQDHATCRIWNSWPQ